MEAPRLTERQHSLGGSALLLFHRVQCLVLYAAAFGGGCWLALGSIPSWFWFVSGTWFMLHKPEALG